MYISECGQFFCVTILKHPIMLTVKYKVLEKATACTVPQWGQIMFWELETLWHQPLELIHAIQKQQEHWTLKEINKTSLFKLCVLYINRESFPWQLCTILCCISSDQTWNIWLKGKSPVRHTPNTDMSQIRNHNLEVCAAFRDVFYYSDDHGAFKKQQLD